ncbi:hypothetical protein [Levilactobacillus phage ENFP1]|nr:hypothetical protein [Levilactobacillus phage ENFP1]
MATEADLIQKFKDLDIPVGADFEELIHEAFIGANLAEQVSSNTTAVTNAASDATSAKEKSNLALNTATSNATDISDLKKEKVNISDLPSSSANTLADTSVSANFKGGLNKNGVNVPNDTEVSNIVNSAVESATKDTAYQSKDNNFTGNLLYKGAEVATVDLLQNFYQADDDNTARQKAESLTTPGFVWFSENEKIPAGTVISMNGTGYSTDTTTTIGLVDNLLADFSNVPTGIQLNFSSDIWLNTLSAKVGTLSDFKITPTTMQIPKASIYASSSTNAIYLPLPTVTTVTYNSTNYTVDKSQANCNISNNGGVLTFNRILGGFGSGDTTHYYLLGIDSITAY